MFQLIIIAISIFLFAIMVLAVMYFGGSAHTEATLRAEYAANMNTAAQIDGALHMYYQDYASFPSDGTGPLTDLGLLEHLRDRGYLKDIPSDDWKVDPQSLYRPIGPDATREHCEALNRVAGMKIDEATDLTGDFQGCPPCNGVVGSPEHALATKYKGWPGCQFISAGEAG